ncbi:hypothetical protein DRQ50_06145 [bacterium]|nr:MAG: hypothetical protein DRQ50_06145 [bacterium]
MRRSLALLCFFLSGFAGLVYEIAWIRKASLVFGSTTLALSTVLAVFFGGLALGSWLFGRWGQRAARPIRWYAVLEYSLAATALASPLLFTWVDGLYGAAWRSLEFETTRAGLLYLQDAPQLAALRVGLVALVLLIPTTLMGGTLPLFVRQFVVSGDRLAAGVGLLYGVNTLGALIGTLLAGFVLLPVVGVNGCIATAAVLNVVAGTIALGLKFRADDIPAPTPVPTADPTPDLLRRALPGLFFVAGFLAIGAEVLWTRFLALIIRNSVVTYTLTLATVLAGIVLGSLLAARLADRRKVLGVPRAGWYGLLQLAAAVAVAAMFMPVPWWRALGQGLLPIALLMLPAAILSGSLFPLANRLVITDPSRSGRIVGRMTALNTLGGILGSLLAGFVVVPHLGLATGVRLLTVIGLAAGTVALLAARSNGTLLRGGAVAVAVLLGLVLPGWRGAHLPHDYLGSAAQLVDVAEGHGATLAAVQTQDRLQLQIDRLWQGSDRKGHQIMAAHLPALLHDGDLEDVLVIGVGVGQTAGRFLMHGVQRLDCVDIEPAIFPFIAANFPTAWMNEPQVTLVPEDGRSFVRHTDRRYDIVSVEVGQVFRPGVDVFYTREFYDEVQLLLKPGGLVAQFVPLAFFNDAAFDGVIHTFLEVFPHATLWYNTEELLLVGSPDHTPRWRPAPLSEPVATDLQWSHWGGEDRHLHRPGIMLGMFLADDAVLRDLTAGGAILTDDRPTLAWATADVDVADHRELPLTRRLGRNLSPIARGLAADAPADTATLALATRTRLLNLRDLMADGILDDAVNGMVDGHPGTPPEIIKALHRVVGMNPESFYGWYNLGKSHLLSGDHQGAIRPLSFAVRIRPDNGLARRDHGVALLQSRRAPEALPELRAAVKLRPRDAAAYNYLGAALGAQGDFEAAEQAFVRAMELDPADTSIRHNLDHARRQAQAQR